MQYIFNLGYHKRKKSVIKKEKNVDNIFEMFILVYYYHTHYFNLTDHFIFFLAFFFFKESLFQVYYMQISIEK